MEREKQEKRHGEKEQSDEKRREAPAQRPGTTPGGPLPEGNGATNEPPVFPSHN